MTVAVGEKVLLPEFGGMEVELEGEKYLLFRDLDFLGKMEADAWQKSAAAIATIMAISVISSAKLVDWEINWNLTRPNLNHICSV